MTGCRNLRSILYFISIALVVVWNDMHFESMKRTPWANYSVTDNLTCEASRPTGLVRQRASGYASMSYFAVSMYVWSRSNQHALNPVRMNLFSRLPVLGNFYAVVVFVHGASFLLAHACNCQRLLLLPSISTALVGTFWSAFSVMKFLIYKRHNPYLEQPDESNRAFVYRGYCVWFVLFASAYFITALVSGLLFSSSLVASSVVVLSTQHATRRACKSRGVRLLSNPLPVYTLVMSSLSASIVILTDWWSCRPNFQGFPFAHITMAVALGSAFNVASTERITLTGVLPMVR